MFRCIGDPWKHGTSIWNHTSIYYTTKVISTSGLEAAILDLHAAGNISSVGQHAIELAVPRNMVVAFGIALLSNWQPQL